MPHHASYADVAHSFIHFTQGSFSADQRELVVAAVVLAGQSLALSDDWTSFQPARFFSRLAEVPVLRIEVAMYLMGFFGWLGLAGRISNQASIDLMDRTRHAAPPSPLLAALLQRALPYLTSAAA